jgi:geranylgeranyl pyrophosphate synthase
VRAAISTASDEDVSVFLDEVRKFVDERLTSVATRVGLPPNCLDGLLGKMLRSRLGARLGARSPAIESCLAACAAVELLHTATLCHDDVIDQSTIRRYRPTLWRATSTTAAILVGDLLMTESLLILQDKGGPGQVGRFLDKMREICGAELELEFQHRGQPLDQETWVRLGRAKTGALFAFVARSCAGDDGPLGQALEEVGYRLGTAYQVIDDLIDVIGDDAVTGKTVGRDKKQGVVTRVVADENPVRVAAAELRRQCQFSLDAVADWPEAQKAVAAYLGRDIEPILRSALGSFSEPILPFAK